MTPTTTKKWKCISMLPREKWTARAEQTTSPAVARLDRSSRLKQAREAK